MVLAEPAAEDKTRSAWEILVSAVCRLMRLRKNAIIALLKFSLGASISASSCTAKPATPSEPPKKAEKVTDEVYQRGLCSFYSDKLAGNKTASGEPYDPSGMTCAHKKLKLGSRVQVHLLKTGKKAICKVNDRGPFSKTKIIDLSKGMAKALGVEGNSVHKVELRVVEASGSR